MPLQTMACEKNGNGAGASVVLTAVLVGIFLLGMVVELMEYSYGDSSG